MEPIDTIESFHSIWADNTKLTQQLFGVGFFQFVIKHRVRLWQLVDLPKISTVQVRGLYTAIFIFWNSVDPLMKSWPITYCCCIENSSMTAYFFFYKKGSGSNWYKMLMHINSYYKRIISLITLFEILLPWFTFMLLYYW